MTKDEIVDTLGDEDDFPSFGVLCGASSAAQQLIALEKFLIRTNGPSSYKN